MADIGDEYFALESLTIHKMPSTSKNNQSTESTEWWHLRFTLTIERQYRYIKEYIWFIY